MKTFTETKENAARNWRIVDADSKVLGRVATKIATALRGKDKATFTPHIDTGDFVVVVNAEKVALTGKKWKEKMYYQYSGFRGGMKSQSAEELRAKKPEDLITFAVQGMLPKGALGRQMMTKLKVYRSKLMAK